MDRSFHSPSLSPEAGSKNHFKWKTPDGWSERAGRGMRLATFLVPDETSNIECALVQLPDSGGGLANNVRRWMNQMGIVIPSEQYLQTFLSQQQRFKTSDNFNGILVDLTTVLSGDLTSGKSALAAVITTNEQTLFFTMFGKKEVLRKNRSQFLSLAASLKTAD